MVRLDTGRECPAKRERRHPGRRARRQSAPDDAAGLSRIQDHHVKGGIQMAKKAAKGAKKKAAKKR
jgi:hypothetical protein